MTFEYICKNISIFFINLYIKFYIIFFCNIFYNIQSQSISSNNSIFSIIFCSLVVFNGIELKVEYIISVLFLAWYFGNINIFNIISIYNKNMTQLKKIFNFFTAARFAPWQKTDLLSGQGTILNPDELACIGFVLSGVFSWQYK